MANTNRRRVLGFAGGAAALSVFRPLVAQEKFPSRPIEVVTHAGVGGGTDITARMMMVHAPGVFKNEFVVVNRVGGSGAAVLQYMLERPRDGHTIELLTQRGVRCVRDETAAAITEYNRMVDQGVRVAALIHSTC